MPLPVPQSPEWLHAPVPPEWQWAGLLFSVVALVVALMALPTVFQMVWGRVRIDVEFGSFVHHETGLKFLDCRMYNRPVSSAALRAVGVSRVAAEDVVATFEVLEDGTNRLIDRVLPELTLIGTETRATRIRLPPSHASAKFTVVVATQDGAALIEKPNTAPKDFPELARGRYRAVVSITAGENRTRARRAFGVGGSHYETDWLRE